MNVARTSDPFVSSSSPWWFLACLEAGLVCVTQVPEGCHAVKVRQQVVLTCKGTGFQMPHKQGCCSIFDYVKQQILLFMWSPGCVLQSAHPYQFSTSSVGWIMSFHYRYYSVSALWLLISVFSGSGWATIFIRYVSDYHHCLCVSFRHIDLTCCRLRKEMWLFGFFFSPRNLLLLSRK